VRHNEPGVLRTRKEAWGYEIYEASLVRQMMKALNGIPERVASVVDNLKIGFSSEVNLRTTSKALQRDRDRQTETDRE